MTPDDDGRYEDAWIENDRVLVRLHGIRGGPEVVKEVAKVSDLVKDYRDTLEDHVCHAMCQLDLGGDDGQVRSGDREEGSEGEGGSG